MSEAQALNIALSLVGFLGAGGIWILIGQLKSIGRQLRMMDRRFLLIETKLGIPPSEMES